MSISRNLCAASAMGAASLFHVDARALDTTEPFELGLSDVEAYWGHGGIGRPTREVSFATVLGAGLTPSVSFWYELGFSATESLCDAHPSQGGTLFATVLDTDHLDLDVTTTAALEDGSDVVLTPGLEYNLDVTPQLGTFGAFLLVAVELSSDTTTVPVGIGSYLTLSEGHQLLVQADAAFALRKPVGEPATTLETGALGYNVVVHESVELITEVGLQVPREDVELALSSSVGFLATLP